MEPYRLGERHSPKPLPKCAALFFCWVRPIRAIEVSGQHCDDTTIREVLSATDTEVRGCKVHRPRDAFDDSLPRNLDFIGGYAQLGGGSALPVQGECERLGVDRVVDTPKALVSKRVIDLLDLLPEVEFHGPDVCTHQVIPAKPLASLVDPLEDLNRIAERLLLYRDDREWVRGKEFG